MTDTGDRPQKYTTGKTVLGLGVVWQVIKAVFIGFGGKMKTNPISATGPGKW